jgi:hypothetical protein
MRTKFILPKIAKDRPIYNKLAFGIGITFDEEVDLRESNFAPPVDHGGKHIEVQFRNLCIMSMCMSSKIVFDVSCIKSTYMVLNYK